MDSITQAALGATIAQAGFAARLGRGAVVFGAVCGTLPDLDIIVRAAGEWAVLAHHRGPSHSLPVLVVAAPAVAWLGWRWFGRARALRGAADPASAVGRPERWSEAAGDYRGWLALALAALLTHPLLDLLTTYGTQVLWPLSDRRFATDAISIIDLFVTLPLIAALCVGRWTRDEGARRRAAWAALAAALFYIGMGQVQSARAERLGAAELARDGFAAAELRAVPTPLNIFVWRVLARSEDGALRIGYVSTLAPGPIGFIAIDPTDDPLVERALASPKGRLFAWFAMGMVSTTVERSSDGARVVIHDQRYGLMTRPGETMFRAEADFDRSGRLRAMRHPLHYQRFDVAAEFRELWRLMLG